MAVSEETKDAVAKVGFAAFMAAAMGPVGIIIAALSVGIDRAISGEGGRQASEDLSRQQVADQRQWLAEDRAFRERLRADRRRWLDEGADPAKEPPRPSRGEAVGRWWHRLYARMVVFSDDFKRGFRDGWHAAKDARARGADWRETARTRPDHPDADDLDWDDFDEPKPGPVATDDKPGRQTGGGQKPDSTSPAGRTPQRCERCGETLPPGAGGCPLCFEDQKERDEEEARRRWGKPPGPIDQPVSDNEGDTPVTTPNSPSGGESNVSVLRAMLQRIGGTITKVEAGVDDLNQLADALAAQVREAYEFATRTGQIAATKQALDSASAVVAKLKALVAAASEAAVEAVDQVAAARGSLRTAEAAEDSLRQAGGSGDAVATARAA